MTARAWVPLLRKLRECGWEHVVYGGSFGEEHTWDRNHNAVNQQRITWNPSGGSVQIGGTTVTGVNLSPAQAGVVLAVLGAFRPPPPRVDRPLTPLQKAARSTLLTMAARDPEVSDGAFGVLVGALEPDWQVTP